MKRLIKQVLIAMILALPILSKSELNKQTSLSADPFLEMTIAELKKIEGNFYTGITYGNSYPTYLKNFYAITSVKKSDIPDANSELKKSWDKKINFLVTGSYLETADFMDVESNYNNAQLYLVANFDKKKASGSKWVFTGFSTHQSKFKTKGTENSSKSIYRTLGRYGFNEVYKKEAVEIPVPYTVSDYQDKIREDLKQAFILLDQDKTEEGKTLLLNHLTPEIAEHWVAFVKSYRSKFLGIYNSSVHVNLNGFKIGETDDAYVSLNIRLTRKSGKNDKALLKKYKLAGMSKTELKKGGYLSLEENIKMKVEFEGIDFIPVYKEGPKFTKEILF